MAADPEAKDCQDEGISRVVGEQVICPQEALVQSPPEEIALAPYTQ